jgi:hypothetical protein
MDNRSVSLHHHAYHSLGRNNALSTITELDRDPKFCSSVATGLCKAFNTPYLGEAAINFIIYLEKMNDEAQPDVTPMTNAISVIQASGTGKSRRCDFLPT